MAWEDALRVAESGQWVRLTDDGDETVLLIVREPEVVVRPGMRGGQVRRYYVGVVEDGRPAVWDIGARTLRALAEATRREVPCKVRVRRRGRAKDPATTYEIERLDLTDADRQAADQQVDWSTMMGLSDGVAPF